MDTLPEAQYDGLARLAAATCGTPISLVTLIDCDRQWFKARVGLDATETPRSSFCVRALAPPGLLVVPDATADAPFRDNPLVTGEPGIRAYAGAVVTNPDGFALGTLCWRGADSASAGDATAATEVPCSTSNSARA